jgi:hypothetical protein
MYEEIAVLGDGVRLELRLRSPTDYRLACLKDGRLLVEVTGAAGAPAVSVEKLRYAFERQVEDALRQM